MDEHDQPRDPDPGAAARRARRAWIAAHHPDRGGDPQAFQAGLPEAPWLGRPSQAPVTAYRRGGLAGAWRRLARACRRCARARRRYGRIG